MGIGLDRRRERRWIILGQDGRFVTLGRASDPSEAELRTAEAALHAQGLAGWLAIMEGNPNVVAQPRLLMVRTLGKPTLTFEQGSAAFRLLRVE